MIIVKEGKALDEIPKKWSAFCEICQKETAMKKHGSYQRYLIDYSEDEIVNKRVTVPRYRCEECKTTHAVLQECYIPNGSYHRTMKEKVLKEYRNKMTIDKICQMYNISIDLLYSWVNEDKRK